MCVVEATQLVVLRYGGPSRPARPVGLHSGVLHARGLRLLLWPSGMVEGEIMADGGLLYRSGRERGPPGKGV